MNTVLPNASRTDVSGAGSIGPAVPPEAREAPAAPAAPTAAVALDTGAEIVRASIALHRPAGADRYPWRLDTLPGCIFQSVVDFVDLPSTFALQRTSRRFPPLVENRIPDAAQAYLPAFQRRTSLLLHVGVMNERALQVVVEHLAQVPGPWVIAALLRLPDLVRSQYDAMLACHWPCPSHEQSALCALLALKLRELKLDLGTALKAIQRFRMEYRLPLFRKLLESRTLQSLGHSTKKTSQRCLAFVRMSLPERDRPAALVVLARKSHEACAGMGLDLLRRIAREAGSDVPVTPLRKANLNTDRMIPDEAAAPVLVEVVERLGAIRDRSLTPAQLKDWSELFAYLADHQAIAGHSERLRAIVGLRVPSRGKGGVPDDPMRTILGHLDRHDIDGKIVVLIGLSRALRSDDAHLRATRKALLNDKIFTLPSSVQLPLRQLLRLLHGTFASDIGPASVRELTEGIRAIEPRPVRVAMFHGLLSASGLGHVDPADMDAAIRVIKDDIRAMAPSPGGSRTGLIAQVINAKRWGIAEIYNVFRDMSPWLEPAERQDLIARVAKRVAPLISDPESFVTLRETLDSKTDRLHWLALFERIQEGLWRSNDMQELLYCIDILQPDDRSEVLSRLVGDLPTIEWECRTLVRMHLLNTPVVPLTQAAAEGLIDSVLAGYPRTLPYRTLVLTVLQGIRAWLAASIGQARTEAIIDERLQDFERLWTAFPPTNSARASSANIAPQIYAQQDAREGKRQRTG